MRNFINFVLVAGGTYFLYQWMKQWTIVQNLNLNGTLKTIVVLVVALIISVVLTAVIFALYESVMNSNENAAADGAGGVPVTPRGKAAIGEAGDTSFIDLFVDNLDRMNPVKSDSMRASETRTITTY